MQPRRTPLYAMYSTQGAEGQQHASHNPNNNRASDLSAYEGDHIHQAGQQQQHSNLNPGSARYSDYGTPQGGITGDSRRDSYIDPATSPHMTEDLRKYHSQGGAYTNLGNEPSSPIMGHHHPQHQQSSTSRGNNNNDDGDGDSNGDSSSNGSTKVDSRSPSAYRVRGAGGNGQGYAMGSGSQGHGSEVCTLFSYFLSSPLCPSSFPRARSPSYPPLPSRHPPVPGVARAPLVKGKGKTHMPSSSYLTPHHACTSTLSCSAIRTSPCRSTRLPYPSLPPSQPTLSSMLTSIPPCSRTSVISTLTAASTLLGPPTTRLAMSMHPFTTLPPLRPLSRTTPTADSGRAHTPV